MKYHAVPSPVGGGRWLVVYQVPGAPGVVASVADCRTEAVARSVAKDLNERIN